jgi:hypothetical protein
VAKSAFRLDIDPADLRRFTKDMRDLGTGRKIQPLLRKNLKTAAEPAAAQVRANASWSSRIPGAVGVQTRFTGKRPGVSIFVSRKKAPHARPLENSGKGGTFKHPVFARTKRGGRRYVTVQQQARPFFFNDLAKRMPEVDKAVGDAIDDAARAAGFR